MSDNHSHTVETEMATQKKVMIVDDQESNVIIYRELLEDQYELEDVSTGEQCLERIQEFDPDVVLLDIMMPGIDGYETCRQIKENPKTESIHVILISAKSCIEDRLEGYGAGANDYIARPFDHDEFLAKVKIQLRLKEALTKLAYMHKQLSLQNARLDELVLQRTSEIIETRDVTVFALAKLAESRDPESGGHLERIRHYAQILAEELAENSPYANAIDEQFIDDLHRSSPLHDIGKVGIPDVFLLKPGQLTTAEFEILKQHTLIGERTLKMTVKHSKSGNFLTMASEIARSHHERFNGSGYPDGNCGEDIPLAARIVALADVYDAITSVRVYKSDIEPEVAKSMIEDEIGKHFDPVIVEAFRNRWDDFLNVRGWMQSANLELVECTSSNDARR